MLYFLCGYAQSCAFISVIELPRIPAYCPNYAMFLAEQQSPEKGISVLQKLSKGIKEYNSDCCLDYAIVQETLGTIYLMTANLPQAKTHFKRAFKIYEKIWADEPEIFWNITAFTTGLAKDTKNLSQIKLWTKSIIF